MTIPAGLHLTPVDDQPQQNAQDVDPIDAFKALRAKAAGATADPIAQFKALRASQSTQSQQPAQPGIKAAPAGPSVAADASSALPRNRANPTGDYEATAPALAANYLNALQVIPGMERAQAYLGSAVNNVPYETYLAAQRKETGAIPAPIRIGEQVATGALLGRIPGVSGLLPANPAKSGAILGGASQALSADPMDSGASGVAKRGLRTALGAGLGYGVGSLLDKVTTGTQAALERDPDAALGVSLRPSTTVQKLQMQADRAASAKQLFGAALAEGRENEVTPAIQQFLAEDDIAPIVAKIQAGRTGSQLDTPGLLDRVYKELSAQQKVALKALAVADPTNPTAAVSKLADVKAAKEKFINAVSTPGTKPPLTLDVAPETYSVDPVITPGREPQVGPVQTGNLSTYTAAQRPTVAQAFRDFPNTSPGTMQGPGGPAFQLRGQPGHITPGVEIQTPAMRVQTAPAEEIPAMMPSYKTAVEDFANRSRAIQSLGKGYEALRNANPKNLPAFNRLETKTPEAFADWLKTASPEDIAMARQGILGGVKQSFGLPGKTFGPARQAVSSASDLLRQFPGAGTDFVSTLQRLGLLGINAAAPR